MHSQRNITFWNVLVNRVESKRKVSQVFKNYPQASRLIGRPKTDGGTVYRQILINAKLETLKRIKKQS